MKILAFVDLHGSQSALDKIEKKAKKADIIICAGDISIFENNLEDLLNHLNKLKKPVLIIPGNHEDENDLKDICNLFDNIECIHKTTFTKDSYIFIGYGGGGFSMADKDFEKFSKKLKKNLKKYEKIILVTHAPPYKTKLDNISKEPCGNKSIKNFILKAKPDLAISGHLHENAGKEDKIGKTFLINPGPKGKILTI